MDIFTNILSSVMIFNVSIILILGFLFDKKEGIKKFVHHKKKK